LCRHIHHCQTLQRSFDKHGIGAFSFEVLELVAKSDLLDREQHWMDALGSADKRHGYNACIKAISRIGMKHSDATRLLLSARSATKGKPMKPGNKAALLAANTGRIVSDATRMKMRIAATGKTHGAAAREKLRVAHTGKTLSSEHRSKIAAALRRNSRQLTIGLELRLTTHPEGK
jgi:group I intron endonuclease